MPQTITPFKKVTFEMNDGSFIEVDPKQLLYWQLNVPIPHELWFSNIFTNENQPSTIEMKLEIDPEVIMGFYVDSTKELPAGPTMLEAGEE